MKFARRQKKAPRYNRNSKKGTSPCVGLMLQQKSTGGVEATERQKPNPREDASERKVLTRRAFIGIGGVVGMTLLVGTRLAWGGVGGGYWGSAGGVAQPGAHFGHDAGWSYSYDGRVWLAASCNCSVGRTTELFLEVGIDAYVACGGVWSPTWSPDMPDTPTYAYIRNDSGAWLTSAYWNIDTTYDHNYYAYMIGASLRVAREAWDWLCWCGADIKGLGGSAPGTHSVAEVSQWIPRHPLVDDRSWQGKVVTLKPRAAEHLYMDAIGGAATNGANVAGWSNTDTTNQNWIVLTSAQGRTCFVPVHVGGSPLYLDIANGVWDDGANVQLWTGNAGAAQSFWLHGLGSGYYLIVPECSGCALDLYGGGQADGTNIAQWNCYGNWNNTNQHWKLEGVRFRERKEGSIAVSGDAEAGGVLIAADPGPRCIPYNYPQTSGMFYRYVWYRGSVEGELLEVISAASEESAYRVAEQDENFFLTCVITAHTRFSNAAYEGKVFSSSVYIRSTTVTLRCFADGEKTPCFQMQIKRGDAVLVPPEAWSAAAKPDCLDVEGWFLDAAATLPLAAGTLAEKNLDIYAYNRVELMYDMADTSCFIADASRVFYSDEALLVTVDAIEEMLPSTSIHRYAERVAFVQGRRAWYEDMGRVREVVCESGAYASKSAAAPSMRSARLTRTTTVYLVWRLPAYDGIALS